jgi:putative transposase
VANPADQAQSTGQSKGKIERAFETIRGQFLVEVTARGVADLAELNRLFSAWVEVHYHRAVHSETKARPIERFFEAGPPSLPTPEMLREAFLWAERRTVSKTAVVSLFGNAYEVDAALIGRRVELVFDPLCEISHKGSYVQARIMAVVGLGPWWRGRLCRLGAT